MGTGLLPFEGRYSTQVTNPRSEKHGESLKTHGLGTGGLAALEIMFCR